MRTIIFHRREMRISWTGRQEPHIFTFQVRCDYDPDIPGSGLHEEF